VRTRGTLCADGAGGAALTRRRTIVERYALIRPIAESAQSIVWKAIDTWEDRQVCVKLLRRPGSHDFERLERAFHLHRHLPHRNVVQVLDMIRTPTEAGVVMEWIEGVDLERYWLGLPLASSATPGQRWAVLKPLLERLLVGVEALHERGIVHRDLKPQNILVRPNCEPVILDLDIARATGLTSPLTPAGRVVGTPLYIPPEVLQRGPSTPAGDLYSLGVMLYQYVLGRPPFVGTSFPDLVASILSREVPPVREAGSDMPRAAADLIDALMARDPDQRPADVAEIRSRIGLPPEPPLMPTLTELEPEPPFVGRRTELEWFRATLREWCGRGGGVVVALSGEPGIGKSRLLRQWTEIARDELFSEGFSGVVKLTACLPQAPRVALLPALDEGLLLPTEGGGQTGMPAPPDRAGRGGLVYLVDDADLADLQTRAAFAQIVAGADQPGGRPLLLVAAGRSTDSLKAVAGPLRSMATRELGPLERADLPGFFVPEERERATRRGLTEEMERYCAGRPDRIRQFLIEGQLQGRLDRSRLRWTVTTTGSEGLGPPVYLETVAQAQIFGWLDVLGSPVPLGLLLAVAPKRPSAVLAGILASVRSGNLQVRRIGNHAWVEAVGAPPSRLVLPAPLACALHERAARWLTLHLPGGGVAAEWVAQHWVAAGEHRRAAGALHRCASASASAGFTAEALRMLRLAEVYERRARILARSHRGAETESDVFERRDLLRALSGEYPRTTDRFRWSTTG